MSAASRFCPSYRVATRRIATRAKREARLNLVKKKGTNEHGTTKKERNGGGMEKGTRPMGDAGLAIITIYTGITGIIVLITRRRIYPSHYNAYLWNRYAA